MSIALREGFADLPLKENLEDLLVRFVVNNANEDLSSIQRVFFQLEEAHWFYLDYLRSINPSLPSLKMKGFTKQIIDACPAIWKWGDPNDALIRFGKYKSTIPVRGVALFNEGLTKMILVQGTESSSWSFPRGKINKEEKDAICAVRECLEETGFDATELIDENEYVERTIRGKNYKIFLIKNVPEDYEFRPLVRNEINEIKWKNWKKIAKECRNGSSSYYLVNTMFKPIDNWVNKQKGIFDEESLKKFAESQMKILLGIGESKKHFSEAKKQIDAGREILDILHNHTINNNSNAGLPSIFQKLQQQMPIQPIFPIQAIPPPPPPGFFGNGPVDPNFANFQQIPPPPNHFQIPPIQNSPLQFHQNLVQNVTKPNENPLLELLHKKPNENDDDKKELLSILKQTPKPEKVEESNNKISNNNEDYFKKFYGNSIISDTKPTDILEFLKKSNTTNTKKKNSNGNEFLSILSKPKSPEDHKQTLLNSLDFNEKTTSFSPKQMEILSMLAETPEKENDIKTPNLSYSSMISGDSSKSLNQSPGDSILSILNKKKTEPKPTNDFLSILNKKPTEEETASNSLLSILNKKTVEEKSSNNFLSILNRKEDDEKSSNELLSILNKKPINEDKSSNESLLILNQKEESKPSESLSTLYKQPSPVVNNGSSELLSILNQNKEEAKPNELLSILHKKPSPVANNGSSELLSILHNNNNDNNNTINNKFIDNVNNNSNDFLSILNSKPSSALNNNSNLPPFNAGSNELLSILHNNQEPPTNSGGSELLSILQRPKSSSNELLSILHGNKKSV